MPQTSDWWARQFVEEAKEIARLYMRYEATCDLAVFDFARERAEELNRAYDLPFDFLDFVKLGRSLLAKCDLPKE